MGRVKIDIHKSERKFEAVRFSDVDAIKGLIKFRSKLDRFRNAHLDCTSFDSASVVGDVNQELIALYATLDDYLEKCELNIKQKFIIQRLMDGYTEYDLAELFKTDPKYISNVLNTVANKIKRINDLEWKYNYVYMNLLKSDFDYKTCVVCGERKPATSDFFGKDNRNKDGFKSVCKKCDAYKTKLKRLGIESE